MTENIIFYGGKQAGMVALLTLLAKGHKPRVIAEDELISNLADSLRLEKISLEDVGEFDLFICCHGRKIVKKKILEKGICINLHPCLYKYKGAFPIKRLLEDGNTKASVGCHIMTEKVDEGPVIYEEFKEIEGKTQPEAYNEIYPLYSKVLVKSLERVFKDST